MVLLVGEVNELKIIRKMIVEIVDVIIKEEGIEVFYIVGIMIEIFRVCLIVDEIV